MKHFKDIKEKCLEPLFRKLDDLKKEFTFGESGPSWSRFRIEKLLKSDNPWWKTFSFKKAPVKYFFKAVEKNMILNKLEMGSYEILYEDLKNHYPELYRDLQELESLIKTKYEEYLQSIHRLLEAVENDPEFKELEKQFKNSYVDKKGSTLPQNVVIELQLSNNLYSRPYYDAVVFLALDIDESHRPNIYSYIECELDRVLRLGKKFYSSTEAQKLRNLINEFRPKIETCIRRINEIIEVETELKGKCKFL